MVDQIFIASGYNFRIMALDILMPTQDNILEESKAKNLGFVH